MSKKLSLFCIVWMIGIAAVCAFGQRDRSRIDRLLGTAEEALAMDSQEQRLQIDQLQTSFKELQATIKADHEIMMKDHEASIGLNSKLTVVMWMLTGIGVPLFLILMKLFFQSFTFSLSRRGVEATKFNELA